MYILQNENERKLCIVVVLWKRKLISINIQTRKSHSLKGIYDLKGMTVGEVPLEKELDCFFLLKIDIDRNVRILSGSLLGISLQSQLGGQTVKKLCKVCTNTPLVEPPL